MSNKPREKGLYSARKTLKTASGKSLGYYSLKALQEAGLCHLEALPFSIRVLLESVLRNGDGFSITEEHVQKLASWAPKGKREETPYKPARVILQDFTGVPSVVDLAAMRDAMARLGGDAGEINPFVPCDLVIDHSVQVDNFGTQNALALNEKIEFHRNKERYQFLKWGQAAFKNLQVVPPATGIVHQVNLEYLSPGVFLDKKSGVVYPDSCVGTDSHTTMVNGLGVLAWGVGGIEAEAVMLGQAIYMLVPDVIGIKLSGELPQGSTATDLVLRITEVCREIGVVGKFVEFFGPGLVHMSVADRATIGNMAPEQGSTVSFFPVDEQTLNYLKLTGRSEETVALAEVYYKEQGLFRTSETPDPQFTKVVELDLGSIEPAVSGPKRPHDRVDLSKLGPTYRDTLTAPVGPKGLGLSEKDLDKVATIEIKGEKVGLTHGDVVIAAITSCTNTSNPSVMLAAGLLAKKAVEKGLKVKPYVKTSLAPGSTVVKEYLTRAGLLTYLEQLGFHIVGYGCTTCIGNSGPLPEPVAKGITESQLVVSAVLSGNRNFEGRVHPLTRTNYLASPPLVVAYALFGTTAKDITSEPIGKGKNGEDVYLKDIWPSLNEVQAQVEKDIDPEMFKKRYADVFQGSEAWQKIPAENSLRYAWDEDSTYIQNPPFFENVTKEKETIKEISGAKVLGLFADSITTDHISPAGAIAPDSPAAKYLSSKGIKPGDFNSYGSRRGNHYVMMRGTFANIRIKNKLVPGSEGNVTCYHSSGEKMSFFDAAEKYRASSTPLIIIAGKEYGCGSSRDWAAKGPYLLGVKAVIAESYERIHRSNLIGMGILPLQFRQGENAESLGLVGNEDFNICIDDTLQAGQEVRVEVIASSGEKREITVLNRIDTPVEIQYFRDGGILCTVLKNRALE